MKHLLQLPLLLLCIVISSKAMAQQNKTMYIFGHSLIVHDPPAISTPSNETTVPHWLHFLAGEAGNSIAVSGQYGFLEQHDDLPPISQWGFDHVAPAWESDTENFTDANFDTFLLTAGSHIQGQPANVNYYNSNVSPLSATLTILDWIDNQEPGAVTYIYENWPELAIFTDHNQGFPPTSEDLENYHERTLGSFHDWWIEYQDFVHAARPNENIRMIPVGPIISKLLTETNLDQIPALDLYEDSASHGRPTLYFLAGLITYMAVYEEKAPSTYTIPNTVNSLVQDNFQSTIDFIWNELLAFNYSGGSSRVFANNVLHVISNDSQTNNISVVPNPAKNFVDIISNHSDYSVDLFDVKGIKINISPEMTHNRVDISNLPDGLYFLKINIDGNQVVKKILKS
ncbi:T9SS type A sorting domain-containing protein [Flavivirga algicola]|uniref:T9SS type A sorting domain-containing protein n=1 Tax=Flavivirga algicola TaxID=2729136 RepID=A0ABX1RRX4_9FLAO|nr:T9SS type A sorting domain-containing protein [Flavivirga algicola]NMH85911.1 T9SS type A sorting domain-containing protein [Flavivirga algicola]